MGLIGRIQRVTAAAVALALAVVAVSLVGSAAAERDVVVRRGRGTSHRLDTIDGITHAHEVSEPDTAPSGRTIGETAPVSSEQAQFNAPTAVHVPASVAIGQSEVGAVGIAPVIDTPLKNDVRPTRGRSPPIP